MAFGERLKGLGYFLAGALGGAFVRKSKWPFWIFGYPAVILAGASLGMYLQKRILEQPSANLAFAVDRLSNGGLGTFARGVAQANEEVLVVAHQITSERLVTSLCDAGKKGIRVKILLDGVQNADPTRGALGFFVKAKGISVRISKQPLLDQYLVIDTDRVFFTSAPWTASAASAEVEASAVVIQHVGFSRKMARRFDQLFEAAVRCK